ncbi:helix-turn-helix transcriptional regulator [Luteimonas sp. Sa2BVA3]|uniref:Helix-turn-helix transcriptional regulator n=1 Tax=Luteimonas colneyensis TaxID=2762230 RepID=A0ABR8UHW1_9GAMM|nr:helix-turn-helix transcriptional regulator [Luteimonas colneyensis]MBD7987618.1 helix-turn-helix transcriptional regulator [Luteimonas colneyensis]
MPRRSSKRIHWRGQTVAAEHGVLSCRALYVRLKPLGLELSESQLTRIYRGQPKRMNLHVLALFCHCFGVTPQDLLVLVDQPRRTKNVVPMREPESPKAKDLAKLVGPAVPALPEGRWRS